MIVYLGSNKLKKVYLGNTEIKKIYVGNNLVYGSRLPEAYQEVEYIQTTGTQYIILGNQFKTSRKVVFDFQLTLIGGDYIALGMRDSGGYRYGIDAWDNYFKIISGGSGWTGTKIEDTNRHVITINKDIAIVDNTSYNISYINYTFGGGIGISCYARVGETFETRTIAREKIYKLDIWNENGVKIYDLIPCYRKSDGVIGLYDIVNNNFYTNSGSGTFIKGPDVN